MFQEISEDRRYGYVRVSSKLQEGNSSLKEQETKLLKEGVPKQNIRLEVGSATKLLKERPVLQRLIEEELQKDDLLFVTRIDRCSRNTFEFLKLQDKLCKKSVTFISLDLPYSDDVAINKLISTNLATIAEFENNRRRDRQKQGIEAAKKNGKYAGRKTVITPGLISEVQDLKENKNLTVTQIAKITAKGRNTIYKVLKEHLSYVPNRLVKQQESTRDKPTEPS